ncbi:hypothetical protein JOC78_003451 [Bacillus ectoiniformans]|uniref:YqzE family protein n=1 Tax=Bacillus ectoiniformans TaxID=1494429 RepID=UPI00195C7EA4|nr:YqzE family protein [Bacillus ectoiniformans]MBM7650460.1 hypothetical protein [Bacillus ectoiniformans]
MSSNDYVRYFTQTVLSYYNEPKDKRKEKRRQKKQQRPTFLTRWFGVFPQALSLLFKKK